MPALRVHVDLGAVEQGIARARDRAKARAQAFRSLKKPLRDDQRDHAKQKEGPEGKWPPRAASTIERARKRGKRLRKPMGRLPTAVAYRAGSGGLVAESRAAWSGVHQEGGRVGYGSRIPARPFLWFSESFLRKAAEALLTPILRELGGR